MSIQGLRKLSELQEAVADRLPSARSAIIALDGKDGAGKSTLASSLAEAFGGRHVEVDAFLNEHQGGYTDHIRYGELDQELEKAHRESNLAVVEGICILDILARIDVEPDISIYVKRIKPSGLWIDELRYFDPHKTADEVIADRIEQRRQWATLQGLEVDEDEISREGADEEIIRYHYRRLPHETSDIVFERVEEDI